MIKSRIPIVPFVVVLLLAVLYGQEISAQSFVNDIRQVDFKDFTFSRPKKGNGTEVIELRKGRYVGAKSISYSLMRSAYGDLTGDGSGEAIILLRGQNSPISRSLDEVFIFTLENGRIVLLTSFEGGKRGDYICSVNTLESNFKVENHLLIIDLAVSLEDDHLGDPTKYYTITYRWNGNRMEEVERSTLKPLLEHRREVG